MPTYLVKWPDEALFTGALAAIGSVITIVMSESGASSALTGAVLTAVLALGRLVYGMVAPTPERRDELRSVREHTEPD